MTKKYELYQIIEVCTWEDKADWSTGCTVYENDKTVKEFESKYFDDLAKIVAHEYPICEEDEVFQIRERKNHSRTIGGNPFFIGSASRIPIVNYSRETLHNFVKNLEKYTEEKR